MPKKKGQAATNLDDALDDARFGALAKSPIFLVARMVWSSRFPWQKLPPKETKMVRDSEREWEEKLGAMVVKAVKDEDEKTLNDLVHTLRHCMAHSKGDGGLTMHDKIRTLALAYYERRTVGIQREGPVTSKDIREYLKKRLRLGKDQEVDQQSIYRLFKKELGIKLARAKRMRGQ